MKHPLGIAVALLAGVGLALTMGCPRLLPLVGDLASGRALWDANNCLTCHGVAGCGGSAPELGSVTCNTLDAKLRDEQTAHFGGKLPDLTDQDIADLAAYLYSITDADCALTRPSTPAKTVSFSMIATHDPTASAYNASCTACHGERQHEGATDGTTLAAHSAMPGRLGSGNERCLTCHGGGVDLVFSSHARLRADMISESGCASSACHGASGLVPFYATDE